MSKKTPKPKVELSDEKCPLCGRFLVKQPISEEQQQRPRFMCEFCELESILEFMTTNKKTIKGNTKQKFERTLKKWGAEYQKALERKISKQKNNKRK